MDNTMKAIEMTGTIDKHRQLRLDGALPFPGPMDVRVLILCPVGDGLDEAEWLQAAACNPAFAFLSDAEEDIYTLADGKPFHDEA